MFDYDGGFFYLPFPEFTPDVHILRAWRELVYRAYSLLLSLEVFLVAYMLHNCVLTLATFLTGHGFQSTIKWIFLQTLFYIFQNFCPRKTSGLFDVLCKTKYRIFWFAGVFFYFSNPLCTIWLLKRVLVSLFGHALKRIFISFHIKFYNVSCFTQDLCTD